MADIIRLLPDALANQIAAGEVVQRPASVVKELLENAVDAGSTAIHLIVKDAGKTLIQVIDDGCGMSETDARMCFERHATSKIRCTEDLFNIRTMGFRGEAMASIAAVAQMEMRTRRKSDELGTLIRIEGSELKTQESTQCADGTSILVKNLFFNVPARRNFLKSNATEMRNILDEFQRVALANPKIAFTLHQNDMEVYNLPTGKLSQRIIGLFGNNHKEQLAACQEDTPLVKITGYIGKPEFAKKTRGEQFFFANNRFIRHNYLHHAVMQAYEGLLPSDCYPFYVLFIEIDPKHIDINVHPTKTEIKFDDERSVYAIVLASVRKALSLHNIVPSIDFDQDINYQAFMGGQTPVGTWAKNTKADSPTAFTGAKPWEKTTLEQSNTRHWEKLYEPLARQSLQNFEQETTQALPPRPESLLTFGSMLNQNTDEPNGRDTEKATFQLHNRFIVTQVKSGMMIIDQQAAHERILYEKYITNLDRKSGLSQQLLFPQTITLNPADFALIAEMQDDIQALGFVYEVFGKNTLIVRGVPSDAPGSDEKSLFEGLLEQFKQLKQSLNLPYRENLARSMAYRACMKAGTSLTLPEMNMLIDRLFACQMPNYTPNGRSVITMLGLDKIEALFMR